MQMSPNEFIASLCSSPTLRGSYCRLSSKSKTQMFALLQTQRSLPRLERQSMVPMNARSLTTQNSPSLNSTSCKILQFCIFLISKNLFSLSFPTSTSPDSPFSFSGECCAGIKTGVGMSEAMLSPLSFFFSISSLRTRMAGWIFLRLLLPFVTTCSFIFTYSTFSPFLSLNLNLFCFASCGSGWGRLSPGGGPEGSQAKISNSFLWISAAEATPKLDSMIADFSSAEIYRPKQLFLKLRMLMYRFIKFTIRTSPLPDHSKSSTTSLLSLMDLLSSIGLIELFEETRQILTFPWLSPRARMLLGSPSHSKRMGQKLEQLIEEGCPRKA